VRQAEAVTGRVPAALFGGDRCNRSSEGVSSADGVAADAPGGGVHLGKIGLMDSLPSRSATVRATHRMRSCIRADKPSSTIAVLSNCLPSSSRMQ